MSSPREMIEQATVAVTARLRSLEELLREDLDVRRKEVEQRVILNDNLVRLGKHIELLTLQLHGLRGGGSLREATGLAQALGDLLRGGG